MNSPLKIPCIMTEEGKEMSTKWGLIKMLSLGGLYTAGFFGPVFSKHFENEKLPRPWLFFHFQTQLRTFPFLLPLSASWYSCSADLSTNKLPTLLSWGRNVLENVNFFLLLLLCEQCWVITDYMWSGLYKPIQNIVIRLYYFYNTCT